MSEYEGSIVGVSAGLNPRLVLDDLDREALPIPARYYVLLDSGPTVLFAQDELERLAEAGVQSLESDVVHGVQFVRLDDTAADDGTAHFSAGKIAVDYVPATRTLRIASATRDVTVGDNLVPGEGGHIKTRVFCRHCRKRVWLTSTYQRGRTLCENSNPPFGEHPLRLQ